MPKKVDQFHVVRADIQGRPL